MARTPSPDRRSPPKPGPRDTSLSLVATCALGLEEILAGELTRPLSAGGLGFKEVETTRGAVLFRGTWLDVWRANLELRTANRVLVQLVAWPAADGDALYQGALKLVGVAESRSWDGVRGSDLFSPERSFRLRATARSSSLTDGRWIALRVKDGLVDGQRKRWGKRSDVDRDAPDLELRVWLFEDRASLLLDTSGEPLDRRGYREVSGPAPMRETLGAAMALAAMQGEDGGLDIPRLVLDPMCGTGTLLAEAGWIALGIPPSSRRDDWAFRRLPGFDAGAFTRLRRSLARGESREPEAPRLVGLDHDPQSVAATRANLARAGLAKYLELSRDDAFGYDPPEAPGLLLVNPPYGERLAESPEQWKRLGDLFKTRYKGWRAAVVAGDAGKGKWIGLRPRRRIPVKNGPLDARILIFDLY